jgi:hypothetical protein
MGTPDHWHALGTILAIRPLARLRGETHSHSIWEAGKMVDAARKYRRAVQVG